MKGGCWLLGSLEAEDVFLVEGGGGFGILTKEVLMHGGDGVEISTFGWRWDGCLSGLFGSCSFSSSLFGNGCFSGIFLGSVLFI